MTWLIEIFARAWRGFTRAAPVRLWAMILAAPPLTAFAGWMVWIIWRGPWKDERQQQQLDILGWGFWGVLFLIGVIVIALASVKVRVQLPGGAMADVDGGDEVERHAEPPIAGPQ